MRSTYFWACAGFLSVAAGAARAGDDVLIPGDPPLTRAVADRKIEYWEWVFGVRLDDGQRAEARQLQFGEWMGGEKEWKERWVRFLAVWHESLATGRADAMRRSSLAALARGDGDAVGRWMLARQAAPAAPVAPARGVADRDADALRLAALRLRHDQCQQFLRDLSDAQARHHETMMVIIRNIGPSGRYEYNPSTGRYDRYVPYR